MLCLKIFSGSLGIERWPVDSNTHMVMPQPQLGLVLHTQPKRACFKAHNTLRPQPLTHTSRHTQMP